MSNKSVNNKADKVPYEIVKISVPVALVPLIEQMVERYQELVVVPDEESTKEAMLNLLTSLASV